MDESVRQDELFEKAVSAIDAGDLVTLRCLLEAHPQLVRDHLESPGSWLRDKVGDSLNGFFARPYLLWFVAEDPVRNGTLPANIGAIAQTIINAAKRQNVPSLQMQLDYAIQLVAWSTVAARCGVQNALLDVLLDAGAAPKGAPENARW
jgi:peptide-methionine (S)-S-oxide reductase